jgi:hypothetical protein
LTEIATAMTSRTGPDGMAQRVPNW